MKNQVDQSKKAYCGQLFQACWLSSAQSSTICSGIHVMHVHVHVHVHICRMHEFVFNDSCIILYIVMGSSYVAPPPETQREGPVNPTPKDYHHLESNRSLLHPPPGPPCSENMVHVHVYSLTPLIDNYMYMYVYIHLHVHTHAWVYVCVCTIYMYMYLV